MALRYAEFARHELDALPLDRAMLAAFAELARTTGAGPVAELGCGPGRVTAHLRDLGLEVFGLDVSPAMIDLARETYPDLRFDVGSMDALDMPDASLNGIVCWYSIIHVPPADVSSYFAEFHRVLAPASHLLVAFFESAGEPVSAFDHQVAEAYRWQVDGIAEMASHSGFLEVGRMSREPRSEERFRRGHLLLRASK